MKYPGTSRVRIGIGYIPILAKSGPNRRFKPGASRAAKTFCSSFERRMRLTMLPDRSFLRRQMPDVFREKIDLGAGWLAVGCAVSYLGFSGQCPVVILHRHCFQHGLVEIVRKHWTESQMEEWRFVRLCPFDGSHSEIDQSLDGSRLHGMQVRRRQFREGYTVLQERRTLWLCF